MYDTVDFVHSRLEVVLDPWIEGLWKAINGAVSKMASDRTDYSNAETPDSSIPDVQLNLLSITDQKDCGSTGASVSKCATAASASAVSDLRPAVSPSQPLGAASVSAAVPHVTLAASLTHSLPPLSESSLNVPALPPPYLDVTLKEADTVQQVRKAAADKTRILSHISPFISYLLLQIVGPSNKETLHEVPISRALQLTRGDSVKTSLLLELDLSVSDTFQINNSKPAVFY